MIFVQLLYKPFLSLWKRKVLPSFLNPSPPFHSSWSCGPTLHPPDVPVHLTVFPWQIIRGQVVVSTSPKTPTHGQKPSQTSSGPPVPAHYKSQYPMEIHIENSEVGFRWSLCVHACLSHLYCMPAKPSNLREAVIFSVSWYLSERYTTFFIPGRMLRTH